MSLKHRSIHPIYGVYPQNGRPTLNEGYGMSLRQHYAGLAMQGAIAGRSPLSCEKLAKASIEMADALIAELEKT